MKHILSMIRMASKKTPHKGMDDSITTTQDGIGPVGLSSGEYVIPADVVSMLGDGDSEAGGKLLDDFVAQIRKKKGKSLAKGKQAKPMTNLLESLA